MHVFVAVIFRLVFKRLGITNSIYSSYKYNQFLKVYDLTYF